ncbi:MAG: HEPN domain-containing protein [Syntrophomonadaceae bacterium]|nr:HEPN domain-containing protein [Syntrophomonadaceae bacterium]
MSDSSRYRDWIQNAFKDLKAARILLDHEGDFNIIAFHAHQAIEKGFKAYLLYYRQPIHSTHSLFCGGKAST